MGIKLPAGIAKVVGKAASKVRKHLPEILLIAGTVGAGASFVGGCKATLKLDEILDEHVETLEKVKNGQELAAEKGAEYSEEDQKKDTIITYLHTGWELVKLYGPWVLLLILSLLSIWKSHAVMRQRNLGLATLVSSANVALTEARDRVREKYGEEAERIIFDGGDVCEVGRLEPGKKPKIEKQKTYPDKPIGAVSLLFDETSAYWHKDSARANAMLARNIQDAMNRKLNIYHEDVTVKDLADRFGIKSLSKEEKAMWLVTGWEAPKDNEPAKYIDLGLDSDRLRDFAYPDPADHDKPVGAYLVLNCDAKPLNV